MNKRKLLIRLLQVVFIVALIVFIGIYLRDQIAQLRENPPTINWPVLILAQIGVTIGLALLPLGSLVVLSDLGESQPPLFVWRTFFISNIAKYLPGSIWSLPGRMFLYQRAGIPTAKSILAVFWEVLLMLAGAAITSLLSLRLVTHYLPDALVFAILALGLGSLIALTLGLRSDQFLNWLKALPLPNVLQRLLNRPDLWLSLPQILTTTAVYMLAWLVIGLSFAGMVYAIAPEITLSNTLEIIGLYAGTWIVGFLIIFTPGGIGVRDVLIALGLSVFLNDPIPVAAAIIARIGWTLAEVTGVAVTGFIYFYQQLSNSRNRLEEKHDRIF